MARLKTDLDPRAALAETSEIIESTERDRTQRIPFNGEIYEKCAFGTLDTHAQDPDTFGVQSCCQRDRNLLHENASITAKWSIIQHVPHYASPGLLPRSLIML